MRRTSDSMRRAAMAALVALAILACPGAGILEYRTLQSDFEQAVAADNAAGLSALTSEARYQEIAAQLTDEYIGGLDERLRPNAYMLRAVCQWRSDELGGARASAATGLSLPNVADYRRDQLILTMIPALVIDSQSMMAWREAGRVASVELAGRLAEDYGTALGELGKAEALIDEHTPESAASYFHYQKWRVLQNWRQVIGSIRILKDDGTRDPAAIREARVAARARAGEILGTDVGNPLKRAADAERDAITPGDPLLDLIRRREQGG